MDRFLHRGAAAETDERLFGDFSATLPAFHKE
jgi:hypothetical protein